MVADGRFDLPTAGKLWGMSGLVGEQVPRGLSFASSNEQPEALLMGGIKDRESNDSGFALTSLTSIPGTFAFGDLSGFVQLFLFIQQLIILWPA
jgi:hypothetical protein